MYRFYVDPGMISDGDVRITGSDFNHIKNALRLEIGDWIVACDGMGKDYISRISGFEQGGVRARVEKVQDADAAELGCRIVLFQGLPKKDKMEFVIQKAVELGAAEIAPVLTRRCVARPDSDKAEKKRERWQAIAHAAAKQSGRGRIPKVHGIMPLDGALRMSDELEYGMIPYELYDDVGRSKEVVREACLKSSIGIFIGPEGGFERDEVESAIERGIHPITLGKRILRTETAGMALLSIMMFQMQ